MPLAGDHKLPKIWSGGLWRLWLIIAEIATLAILSLGTYSGLNGPMSPEVAFVTWFPSALKSLLVAVLFTAAVALARHGWLAPARSFALHRPPVAVVAANVTLFLILSAWLAWTPPLRDLGHNQGGFETTLFLISPAIWLALGGVSILVLFPRQALASAIAPQHIPVALAFFVAMFSYFYFGLPLGKSQTDALISLTMSIAGPIYGLMGGALSFGGYDADGHPVFVADAFRVSMAPSCAGAQGMILAALIALVFVTLERRELRPYRVLLLVPLLVGLIFLINAARIAVLLYIGAKWSPEIAVNGFHSNFGVVSLAFVSILFIAVAQFVPALRKTPAASGVRRDRTSEDAATLRLLAPLAVLVSVSLLTSLFSGPFYWLYPIHIVAAAMAIYWARGTFISELNDVSLVAVIVGVITFIIWIAMVPQDAGKSTAFVAALSGAPVWLSAIWLTFRVVGSVVVVPIAEELAFRGFLQNFLTTTSQSYVGQGAAAAAGVLGSALAFALVHSDAVAALMAGLAYSLVYAYRARTSDAIIAHGVTNCLIAIHVLMLGRWSYW